MYDDDDVIDEYIEVDEQPVYEIIEDDDDDEFDEEGFEEASDDPYAKKGKDDRSFVDQQRLDYDEQKRKKRAEVARLRMKLQTLKGTISKKERELRDLLIELEKEEYREIKEGVIAARKEAQSRQEGENIEEGIEKVNPMSAPGIEFTGTDMDEEVLSPAMQKKIEREAKRERRKTLEAEIRALRERANEEERVVSQLEHELLRS